MDLGYTCSGVTVDFERAFTTSIAMAMNIDEQHISYDSCVDESAASSFRRMGLNTNNLDITSITKISAATVNRQLQTEVAIIADDVQSLLFGRLESSNFSTILQSVGVRNATVLSFESMDTVVFQYPPTVSPTNEGAAASPKSMVLYITIFSVLGALIMICVCYWFYSKSDKVHVSY